MPETTDIEADNMESQNPSNPSHLFLVRLWSENNNEGDAVWCGKVQHVLKGKANQFHDWPALVDILMAMLPDAARRSLPPHLVGSRPRLVARKCCAALGCYIAGFGCYSLPAESHPTH